jgi:hypothetical protein
MTHRTERPHEAVDDQELAVAGEKEDHRHLLVELTQHRRLVHRQGVEGGGQHQTAEEVDQGSGRGDRTDHAAALGIRARRP